MARRQTLTFSMSFLDVISCGFGAVVLFYTIISAQAGLFRIKESSELNAESRRLEQEVVDGYKHLAELRNALQSTEDRTLRAAGLSKDMMEKLRVTEEELSRYQHDTLARREAIERLKADLKQLEESTRRLRASAPQETSTGTTRTPVDDVQQLVTLRIDGQRVLVLVDASASMLDETLVNIIRMRNMPPERRIASDKWQQAVNTVEWIAARLPQSTQFQIYAFDTAPRPLVEGSGGRWLSSKDAGQIEQALQGLRGTAPKGGSSLQNAFAVIKSLDPAPDNVILITDGLPTQGDKPPLMRTLVTMEQREDLMQDAVKSLPPSPPPFSVVLLPMEGDPSAPIYFWRLARSTGGGFLSPARDWP
jgi:von Willebrand factor type A domain